MLYGYFYSIKNPVKASVLDEQTNCIRFVSLVSATFSHERERVLLEYKIIHTTFVYFQTQTANWDLHIKNNNGMILHSDKVRSKLKQYSTAESDLQVYGRKVMDEIKHIFIKI